MCDNRHKTLFPPLNGNSQNKIKNCFNEILEGTMLGSLMKVRIDVFGKAIFFLTCITKAR